MWREEDDSLVYEETFSTFNEAWAFCTRVALLAEKHEHHPTIENTFNEVKLTLTTHDEGKTVTEKDRELAANIEFLR